MNARTIDRITKGTGIFAAHDGKDRGRLINIYNSLVIIPLNKDQNLWKVVDMMPDDTNASPVAGVMATLEECVRYVNLTFNPESCIAYRRMEDSLEYGRIRKSQLDKILGITA